MRLAVLVAVVAVAAALAGKAANMNGLYALSPTPGSNVSLFPKSFAEYPHGAQYFDVYSPEISSLYSQVFWTRLAGVPLPDDIISKFDGQSMAVIGFEVDQVRRTPDGDVSVPINAAYNHHFESTMTGKNARWVEVDRDDPRANTGHHGHGRPNTEKAWIVEEVEAGPFPSSQNFGAANGGEYRKSLHGWAPGYANIIYSPTEFTVTPMQIDTFNRDKMSLTGGPFVSGPVPRNALAPTSGQDAIYSGLLECPLTTRIEKIIQGEHFAKLSDTCKYQIEDMSECFATAEKVGFPAGSTFKHTTGSDKSLPSACTATLKGSEVTVFYNTEATDVLCGGATVTVGAATSLVELTIALDSETSTATINITGPSSVWFGVGFNASEMKNRPWAVVVDGAGNVTERRLADQSPGDLLEASVKVVRSSVVDGKRTVVLTRPFKGLTSDHYTFDPVTDVQLDFINAIGNGPQLAYHKDKTAAFVAILPREHPVCLCTGPPAPFGNAKGSLRYENTTIGFNNYCAPRPRTDLLFQKNPTCDVRTYVGGQIACHHMWSLLDADQEIPWADQPLKYHLKFRFWYQEYDPGYHHLVHRTTWGIASPVEYDVPQCKAGTPTEECIHTITGTWTVPKLSNGKDSMLVAAHFHCHAPTCLSVTLYKNDTGEIICREEPLFGGTGVIHDHKFDEPGYIAVPPCLWGGAEHGLTPPVLVGGQTLHAIKHSNSTYGHHGEMAWLQVFYIEV